MSNAATQTTPDFEQFLTFRLGEEQFGVHIQQVQGIQGWSSVTELPDTPPHVLGVIDLRGTVVPIIDLRRRLGFKRCDFNATTVVIVVKVSQEGSEGQTFGLVVDAVSEVCDVPAGDRKPSPDFGGGLKAEYVLGLAADGERMVILLDLDCLMSDPNFAQIEDDADETDDDADEEDGFSAHPADNADSEAAATGPTDEDETQATDIDADALEQSFALLAPMADALATRFYEKLFEAYPDVQPMFADTDMAEQRRKLVAAVQLVIANVRTPEKLDEPLGKLGARHQEYGALPEHYGAVASTLIATLAELAGDVWTEALESTWRAALELVAAKMLAGAASEEAAATP